MTESPKLYEPDEHPLGEEAAARFQPHGPGGNVCPATFRKEVNTGSGVVTVEEVCGGEMEFDSFDGDDWTVWQNVRCLKCGAVSRAIYEFVGLAPDREGSPAVRPSTGKCSVMVCANHVYDPLAPSHPEAYVSVCHACGMSAAAHIQGRCPPSPRTPIVIGGPAVVRAERCACGGTRPPCGPDCSENGPGETCQTGCPERLEG